MVDFKSIILVKFPILVLIVILLLSCSNQTNHAPEFEIITLTSDQAGQETVSDQVIDSGKHAYIHPEVQVFKEEKVRVVVRVKDKDKLKDFDSDDISDDYVTLEVDQEDLEELSDEDIEVFPNREYHILLTDSVPAMNAQTFWNLNYTGNGVRIAILDTGVESTHPDLIGRVVLAQDFSATGNPEDYNGHGTHVAATAAGSQGVAPDASILNAKVLDNLGDGTTSSISSGIYWAIDPDDDPSTDDGADIISMSLGAPYSSPDPVIDAAIEEAVSNGITVVIASGNCGPGGNCGSYVGVTVPGSNSEALTVGATDNNMIWHDFSGGDIVSGEIKPDVVAPGVSITSATVNAGYTTKTGTSMATPHVAGAVALLLEMNDSLTHVEIKEFLQNRAVDLGIEGKDNQYGWGFVDIAQLDENSSIVGETNQSEDDEIIILDYQPIQNVTPQNQTAHLSQDQIFEENFLADYCSGYRYCGDRCWPSCSDSDYPNWNCKPNGKGACCIDGYPYYDSNTEHCTDDPEDYGCYDDYPYPCPEVGLCFTLPGSCSRVSECDGNYFYCEKITSEPNCDSNGEPHCCPHYDPYWWNSDMGCHDEPEGSAPYCGDGICNSGETEWTCPDDCGNPCNSNECVSHYWEECIDNGDTCCEGDDDDSDPLTEFPQYYCNYDETWEECSNEYRNMDGCEKAGDYYCTQHDGLWKLRDCPLGCSGNDCVASVCGNGRCEESESKSSCSDDCYSDIKIVKFVSPPSQVIEGEEVTINVRLKNYGSSSDTTKIEAAIIPKNFWSASFGDMGFDEISTCCASNEYYAANEVTLVGGQTQDIPFTFKVPRRDSIDHCRSGRTAWGDDFMIATYMYDQCCINGNCMVQDDEKKDITVILECQSDIDCINEHGDDYRCDIFKSPNECVYDPCPDECKDYNQYSCRRGDVYRCEQQSGGCYDYDRVDRCYGDEVCISGSSSCQISTKNTRMYLEEAEKGQLIFKQPGDVIVVNLDHRGDETITLNYDSSVFTGDCGSSISITSDKICAFNIGESANIGKYTFQIVGSNSETVEIINNPNMLIITNKDRLTERFDDNSGVRDLLKQAYQTARENSGVVYDTSLYVPGSPFTSYSAYKPYPDIMRYDVNDFSLALGRFVDSKCNGCRNIVLLGDDYVIPYYRVDYADISMWNFVKSWGKNHTETDYLYTDQPYIKETIKTAGDIGSLFDSREHKRIIFVTPDNTAGIDFEITKLKNTINSAYGYDWDDIDTYKSSEIDCDSYFSLSRGTMIVLGNRDNNNAVKCLPWFEIGSLSSDTFKAAIEIERNVWGKNEYALVLSGDVESALLNLDRLLQNPFLIDGSLKDAEALYIHEISDPPDFPMEALTFAEHAGGWVLGTCEEGGTGEIVACSATDFTVSLIPPIDAITDVRDLALYCPAYLFNKITGKKGELFDGIVCGGSLAGTGVTIGKYVGAATIVGAPIAAGAGTAGEVATTIYKRIFKTAKVIFKSDVGNFIKYLDKLEVFKFQNLKTFFGLNSWKDVGGLNKGWKAMSTTLNEHRTMWRLINGKFDPDTLSKTVKTVDDMDDIAKGGESLMRLGILIDDIPYTNNVEKAEFILGLGKLIKRMGVTPEALKRIDFDPDIRMGGRFDPASKVLSFPFNKVPKLNTIAHELAHAVTNYNLYKKIKAVDPTLANKLFNDEEYAVQSWRGLYELMADRKMSKVVDGIGLDDFKKTALQHGVDFQTITGIDNMIHLQIKAEGLAKRDAVQYLGYIYGVAKHKKDGATMKAIADFIDLDPGFKPAKDDIIRFGETLGDEVDILDKPASRIKEVLLDLENQINDIDAKLGDWQ